MPILDEMLAEQRNKVIFLSILSPVSVIFAAFLHVFVILILRHF
jgi:hypothetical protein